MTQIKLKRVYEEIDSEDGFRVLVDKLWPRGMKKEALHYDLWAKEITPSADIRKYFHQDQDKNWDSFESLYLKELNESDAVKNFIDLIKNKPIVTLLYASKNKEHNHALILKEYLDAELAKN